MTVLRLFARHQDYVTLLCRLRHTSDDGVCFERPAFIVRLRIDLGNPIEIILNVDGFDWVPHWSPFTKQLNIDLHLNNSVP